MSAVFRMAICEAWPLLNNSKGQQSIIYHPVVDYDTSESLNCPGASEEEPINSSCHDKQLFLCQLDLPPIWPTESCLNEAYIMQTCLSNRPSEVNASRPLPLHCATYKACDLSICERSLQKKQTGNDGTAGRGRGGSDIVPHIPKLPGDGSAQVTEGSCSPLSCRGQGLRSLSVSATTAQKNKYGHWLIK